MTSETSPSYPGAPWASTSSFRNVSIASMGSPRVMRSGPRALAGRSGATMTAAPFRHREIQHATHELVVRKPARLRRHRHQARGRHAGNGVHLETVRLVRGAQAEVGARHAAAAEHGRGPHP